MPLSIPVADARDDDAAASVAGCPENGGLSSGEIGRKSNMVFGIGALGVCKLHTHFGAVTFARMYQHLISLLYFVPFFWVKFRPRCACAFF